MPECASALCQSCQLMRRVSMLHMSGFVRRGDFKEMGGVCTAESGGTRGAYNSGLAVLVGVYRGACCHGSAGWKGERFSGELVSSHCQMCNVGPSEY